MNALIMAAGAGVRFGKLTKSKPKPLLKISGQPLITWVIKGLKKAGIDQIFITVGYKGGLIKKEIGYSYEGIKISYIDNPQWKKGNLMSLMAAESYIKDDFILCMSDHLFDPTIVEELIEHETNKTVLLGVDKKYQQKMDDTKAFVNGNGLIKQLGKNIIGNYVDTGFFKCKPSIFKYAKKAANSNQFELADCMNIAAASNDVEAYDIKHKFWIDVDSMEELKNYYVINFKKYFENGKW